MKKYFEDIDRNIERIYCIAEEARKKNVDPVGNVEIPLARDMAERVVGLVSVIAPQIKDTNIVPRVHELEETYGKLDWRVH